MVQWNLNCRISIMNLRTPIGTALGLLLGCLPVLSMTKAQEGLFESESIAIETDRDSFTRSPRLVEVGRWVLEGSYSFLDQEAASDGHLFPDLLVRRGFTDWLELRLGWTYEINKFHHLTDNREEQLEEGIINYGVKVALTSAAGWLPASALIGTGYTPTSGDSNDTDFSLEYAAGWQWGGGWNSTWACAWFMLAERKIALPNGLRRLY